MKILLVDDNPMNVELFRDVLEDDAHEVTVATAGPAGLKQALEQGYDLVILDIQLPGIDGYAICRTLRDKGVQGPIVALSSGAMPVDMSRGLEAGFNAYLTKPTSPAALRDAVRRYGRDGTA